MLYNYGRLLNDLRFLLKLRVSCRSSRNRPWIQEESGTRLHFLHLNKSEEAEKLLEEACITDPDNTFLLRNLGSIYAKREEFEKALELFRRAEQIEPNSRPTLYGIALALFKQERMSEASEYLSKIIDQDVNDEIDQLSKDLQREIAQKFFSQDGLRMDAVYYCLGALETYDKMSFTQIQGVTFEISMLGQSGLDPSDSKTTYSLNSIPGEFYCSKVALLHVRGFQDPQT